jgi:hypothetical protein
MSSESPIKIRFAILVAGFKSRCEEHAKYYAEKITMPTLHVMGETDNVIPKGRKKEYSGPILRLNLCVILEMSIELSECFENVTCSTHPGGHYVAASGQQKAVYLDFVKKFDTQS